MIGGETLNLENETDLESGCVMQKFDKMSLGICYNPILPSMHIRRMPSSVPQQTDPLPIN